MGKCESCLKLHVYTNDCLECCTSVERGQTHVLTWIDAYYDKNAPCAQYQPRGKAAQVMHEVREYKRRVYNHERKTKD